jgi:hypothetical protein
VRSATVAVLAAVSLAGCGSASVDELPPSPQPQPAPPTASARSGPVTAVVAGRERLLRLYDARSRTLVDEAPAGVGPTNVAATADRIYVVDTRGEALLIYDRHPRLTLARRVYLPGAPYGIALDRERRRLWVSLTDRSALVGLVADGTAAEVARLRTRPRPTDVEIDSASGAISVTGRAERAPQVIGAQEAYGEHRG